MNKKIRIITPVIIASAITLAAVVNLSSAKDIFKPKSKNNITMDQSVSQQAPSTEEQSIKMYLEQKGLTAEKTASGLYYVIETRGKGARVEKGKQVTVNYTGKLLNGTVFDSSVDPAFNHVSPLPFTVGMGQVIRGWDEGMQLFHVGGKGTLIIPASLAYGAHSPTPKIPNNSVLVFDVEVMGVQ